LNPNKEHPTKKQTMERQAQELTIMWDQAQLKDQAMHSMEDDIRSMREDMKNLFGVLWRAKQNDAGIKEDYEMIGRSLASRIIE